MRAVILAPGSRGDVQPYVAIGHALATLGHRATIVTTLDHEALVRSYGLEPALIPLHVASELARVGTSRAVEGGGVIASFRAFADIARRSSLATAQVGLEAARGAEVLVTNFGTSLLADALGRALGLPVVQAYNVPITPTSAFPGALFPQLDFAAWARRAGHALTRAALWWTARTSTQAAAREVLGAAPASLLPPRHAGLLPGPVLYGFSEAFLPRPADWSADVRITGFWTVDAPVDFTPPPALADFLARGTPPVCIGFGSMSTEHPERVSQTVLDAARAAGVRVVLLSGWAGLTRASLGDDVIALDAVPHAWLYPRCAAVVHHGGAGTTAAALHAGVPAIVVPFHGDQPFWASRVHRLGVGPAPIPRLRLTATRLADAIRLATCDEAMRARARELGERLRGESGARTAAEEIVRRASPGNGGPARNGGT